MDAESLRRRLRSASTCNCAAIFCSADFCLGIGPVGSVARQLWRRDEPTARGIVPPDQQRPGNGGGAARIQRGRISIEDLLDLAKSRAWLETLALRYAIATGDRNWEAEILATAHRLSGLPLRDPETDAMNGKWHSTHRAFHAALVTVPISPPQLQRFREHLYDLSERYRRLSGQLNKDNRDIGSEHERLAGVTLARDAVACELKVEHLVCTTRLILNKESESAERADELTERLMQEISAGTTCGSTNQVSSDLLKNISP